MFKRVIALSIFFIFIYALFALAVEKRYEVPIGESPSQGPEDAPVTLIKFLDYQ